MTPKEEVPVYSSQDEGPVEKDENLKIMVAESVAEIADKMVDFVCDQMEKQQSDKQEVVIEQSSSAVNDGNYSNNTDSTKDVLENCEEEQEPATCDKYEPTGRNTDESDFSDRQGFLHVKDPDLIAFEMLEPNEDEKFENAQGKLHS